MSFPRFLNCVWRKIWEHNLTGTGILSRSFSNANSERVSYEDIIIKNTVISNNHLTPELKLRLITPECKLWYCKSTESEFPSDPFWAIYWPGGQALGRYILDHMDLFQQKNVLDIGSGSGACALAAALSGALHVVANDIDPISQIAIQINSKLNNLKVHTNCDNLIEKQIDDLRIECDNRALQLKWDVILIGDMFYDSEFSKKLFVWLVELVKRNKLVLVGDPGRHALKELDQLKDLGTMIKLSEYCLNDKEHSGFSNCSVYKEFSRIYENMSRRRDTGAENNANYSTTRYLPLCAPSFQRYNKFVLTVIGHYSEEDIRSFLKVRSALI